MMYENYATKFKIDFFNSIPAISPKRQDSMNNQEKLPPWNWAAFSLNILWGIFHKSYWTLLCCIPIFGFFWMFVCGLKGNKWAWENGNYTSVEDFNNKEVGWTFAGIAMTILIIINLLGLIFPSSSVLKLY